ncbi:MAG TPA: PAS domain-containing sensor histidine kinase [Candidatus Binatia bacterium]|jgi:PAS domain S-box-containing protein|nr:PAS domain-containing sensor histidine kinase [Candidatus Binatia bacterium]
MAKLPPKQEFRFDIDELPEPAFVTDPEHVITAANAAAAKLLGYAAAELVGWPLDRIFPKPPRGVSLLLSAGSGATKFEIKVRTKSGRLVLMSFIASPVSGDGKPKALLYLGRDIRLHSLVEGEIKKARDYFRNIVQNSPNGICVTDLNRKVVMANKVAEQLTGYGVDELVGRHVTLFYPDDAKKPIDLMALRRGKTVSREVELLRKDGTPAPALVFYRMVEDERGEHEMIIESYSDLTDRKRLDRLKNEFVFVAAHELRNPVTAIRLLLNLIFEDKRLTLDAVLRGYLLKIQEADERLLTLVDDLLEVSRSESGRLKITVSPQDISEHVKSIFSEMKPTALTKDVQLRHIVLTPMPPVMADPSKLKEIIANLVSNGVKYNVAGGSVTVEYAVRGGMLVTHIADTGIGISDKDQERLFQKFWRSEDVAVRAQAGTGLGLFIVKELVERMGGTLDVTSRVGRGTTFTFTLPLAEKKSARKK